jgi:hypothetical protein
MKRILIIISAIILSTAFLNVNGQWLTGTKSHNNFINEWLGNFNIRDYGAISGDDLEDQTAIQAAITAVVNDSPYGSGPVGGTVFIPRGEWYITAPVKLRTAVHIEVDEGAHFIFPEFYSGAMYATDTVDIGSPDRDGYVTEASVRGGHYGTWGRYKTWDFLDLRANDSDSSRIVYCNFENIVIEDCNRAINAEITNDGWIHGCTFRNFVIQRPKIGIRTRGGTAGTGFESNVFDNIQIQTQSDSTIICVDSLEQGRLNVFTQIMLYDIAGATVAGGVESDFDGNVFVGGNLTTSTGWYDNGDGNDYIGHNRETIISLAITAADGIDTDDWFDQFVYDQHFVIRANLGSAIDITADPQIETTGVRSGQFLTIYGSSDTNTLKLDNANSLRVGGGSITLEDLENITFMYSSWHGLWIEVGRYEKN